MKRETVKKLKLAFWNGYNVPAACGYAGISEEDYERAVAASRAFARMMAIAQMYPRIRARMEMMQKIRKGNGRLALQLLERLEPERYSLAYIRKFGRVSEEE